MDSRTCLSCEREFEPDSFPFGDDVTCSHCGVVMETDWELVTQDDMAWWLVTIKANEKS